MEGYGPLWTFVDVYGRPQRATINAMYFKHLLTQMEAHGHEENTHKIRP